MIIFKLRHGVSWLSRNKGSLTIINLLSFKFKYTYVIIHSQISMIGVKKKEYPIMIKKKTFTSMLLTSHIGCLQLFWSSNISPACLLQWKGDKSLVFVLYLSELLENECCMSSSFPLSLLELPLEYQSEIIVQSF